MPREQIDDCEAHRADQARSDADRAGLVDWAMREIIAGNFDSFAVKLAEREGVMALARIR